MTYISGVLISLDLLHHITPVQQLANLSAVVLHQTVFIAGKLLPETVVLQALVIRLLLRIALYLI